MEVWRRSPFCHLPTGMCDTSLPQPLLLTLGCFQNEIFARFIIHGNVGSALFFGGIYFFFIFPPIFGSFNTRWPFMYHATLFKQDGRQLYTDGSSTHKATDALPAQEQYGLMAAEEQVNWKFSLNRIEQRGRRVTNDIDSLLDIGKWCKRGRRRGAFWPCGLRITLRERQLFKRRRTFARR